MKHDAGVQNHAEDGAADRLLTPRQELFCQNYLTDPNGTRAAIQAGYASGSAAVAASRLLTKDNILQRIAALRAEHGIAYRLERDALIDRLEHVYHLALDWRHFGTAVRAVEGEARLAGLLGKPAEIAGRSRRTTGRDKPGPYKADTGRSKIA